MKGWDANFLTHLAHPLTYPATRGGNSEPGSPGSSEVPARTPHPKIAPARVK